MGSPSKIPYQPVVRSPESHGSEQLKKREDALAEREALVEECETDSRRKNDELAKREQNVAVKEQSLDKKNQDFEKRLDDLEKREEAVRAAEDRLRKSKKGGQAEHLATLEERDRLKDKTKDLQNELEASNGQITQLKAELEKAGKGGESTSRIPVLSGSKAHFSIRSPEVKRPSQKLPEIKPPGQGLPRRKRPGQSLPSGFDAGMLKRYDAGRKAMAMSAEA
jgi:hypothetical protein